MDLLTQKEGPLGMISTEGCCGSQIDSHVTVSERSASEALVQVTATNVKGLPGEAGLQPALVSALWSQASTVGSCKGLLQVESWDPPRAC